MHAKGQASMEYAATYGWAALIVLVLLVAAWQMRLFDIGGRLAPGSSGFSILVPLEWGLTGSGENCMLNVVMANGAGESISGVRMLGGGYCDDVNVPTGGRTVCTKGNIKCAGPGNGFEEEVTVTYNRSSDNQSFRTAGMLWGSSE